MESRTKISDLYPLSPLQYGLLFQSLYAPDSDAYFVQSILALEGKIDLLVLKKAWQIVSNHHHILRTGALSGRMETLLYNMF